MPSQVGASLFWPFQVVKRVGKVAYKLALAEAVRIHPFIHVSMLKMCVGTPDQQVTPLNLVDADVTFLLRPAAVRGKRCIQQAGRPVEQLLIHWEGLDDEAATWEEAVVVTHDYPDLNLEDKVLFRDEGTVMKSKKTASAASMEGENTNVVRRSTCQKATSKWFEDFILGTTELEKTKNV